MQWRAESTHHSLQLLKQCIVDPQVHVAAPVALVLHKGYVCDGALIEVASDVVIALGFHKAQVVKPAVVPVRLRLHLSWVRGVLVCMAEMRKQRAVTSAQTETSQLQTYIQ